MYHNNGGFPRKKKSIVISLEYYVCMHCGVLYIWVEVEWKTDSVLPISGWGGIVEEGVVEVVGVDLGQT